MTFDPPLQQGTLVRRYKRFLADIRLDTGVEITAHIANTGPMTGCAEAGWRVALSHHPDKGRKLPWSWELVRPEPPWGTGEGWVLVNTGRANTVVGEALRARRIPAFDRYRAVRPEVRWRPDRKSRLDFLLSDHEDPAEPPCYVEVKNVTLREGDTAFFPDTVTTRGARHVADLTEIARGGEARAAMFFLVSRGDCASFAPAAHIDPTYAEAVSKALDAGVGLHAWHTDITLEGASIAQPVPSR